jgi:hypothetical protein
MTFYSFSSNTRGRYSEPAVVYDFFETFALGGLVEAVAELLAVKGCA